jgi:hypothetical protein
LFNFFTKYVGRIKKDLQQGFFFIITPHTNKKFDFFFSTVSNPMVQKKNLPSLKTFLSVAHDYPKNKTTFSSIRFFFVTFRLHSQLNENNNEKMFKFQPQREGKRGGENIFFSTR